MLLSYSETKGSLPSCRGERVGLQVLHSAPVLAAGHDRMRKWAWGQGIGEGEVQCWKLLSQA